MSEVPEAARDLTSITFTLSPAKLTQLRELIRKYGLDPRHTVGEGATEDDMD